MSKRPSAAKINSLVEALGRYIGAGRERAGLATQQRLYDRYRKILASMQASHPEVDMESSDFQRQLQQRAEAWWDSKAIRGTGTDW